MTETLSNTRTATRTRLTQEQEDAVMAALPKGVADYLRYDAIADFCVAEVFMAWRRGATEASLLRALRGVQRKRTRDELGAHHPQASLV